ncbi:hypothetical protein WJX73_005691 [Symbiochloris irregularis]|uniref:Uncharacterized protein n=1 Tax=Symbiochloris irregularis TaxID=706552 RepID=A0AAW1PAK9_9CHLO
MASLASRTQSWLRQAALSTFAHLFILCGALDGVLTGSVRTARRANFDKAAFITLWKGTGVPAHETVPAVPKLDRVNSHAIRISHESFEEDRPIDPISAVKPDKASVPFAKRWRTVVTY